MKDSPGSSHQSADPPGGQNSTAPSGGPEPLDAEIVQDATTPPPPPPVADYDERGVPSLDYVREKIETRYATSIGAAELAENTAEARGVAEQEAERERAAKARLEEIRRSMGR